MITVPNSPKSSMQVKSTNHSGRGLVWLALFAGIGLLVPLVIALRQPQLTTPDFRRSSLSEGEVYDQLTGHTFRYTHESKVGTLYEVQVREFDNDHNEVRSAVLQAGCRQYGFRLEVQNKRLYAFVSCGDSDSREVVALDSELKIRWRREISSQADVPSTGERAEFVTQVGDMVVGLGGYGQPVWTHDAQFGFLRATTDEDSFLLDSFDGRMIKLDATGNIVWSCALPYDLISAPKVDPNGRLYLFSYVGIDHGPWTAKLCAVSPEGKLLWTRVDNYAVPEEFALLTDQIIYPVGDRGGPSSIVAVGFDGKELCRKDYGVGTSFSFVGGLTSDRAVLLRTTKGQKLPSSMVNVVQYVCGNLGIKPPKLSTYEVSLIDLHGPYGMRKRVIAIDEDDYEVFGVETQGNNVVLFRNDHYEYYVMN
jgi:hypothetical protein